MNENIDLTELLKGCPKGTKLYSKAFGTVTFDCIKSDKICIKDHKGIEIYYTKSAKYYYAEEDAEIDLFPSKDQRDWSKWHRPFVKGDILVSEKGIPNKFDPKTLQPFDKVLVSCNDEWFCDFFSHYDDAVVKFNCICTGGCPYEYCIPYNDDTKHLTGKSIEEAPEFYRYWEG